MVDRRIAQESRKLTDKKTTLLRSAVERRMTNKTPSTIDLVERAWPFFGYAPGFYGITCYRCGETHMDWCCDKRAVSCLECAVIAAKEAIAEQSDTITRLQAALKDMQADYCHKLCGDGEHAGHNDECHKASEALRSSVGGDR